MGRGNRSRVARSHRVPGEHTYQLALSSDGHWLATADPTQRQIVLWDLLKGQEKMRFELIPYFIPCQLAFSPSGRVLAAVGGQQGKGPGEIRMWDVETGHNGPRIPALPMEVLRVTFSPDGRTLAIGAEYRNLRLLEVATGRQRHEFVGHESGIESLAFSPDGRRLAAASRDAPVYVWDVLGSRTAKKACPEEIDRCWSDLADTDAAKAFQAICRLATNPAAGVRLLRDKLKPAAAPDAKQVARLVQGLDSDSFTERRKAAEELAKFGDTVTDALRKARASATSAEVRRQLDDLLERAAADSSETFRTVRAAEALEWMATPEAAELLDQLARGVTGAA